MVLEYDKRVAWYEAVFSNMQSSTSVCVRLPDGASSSTIPLSPVIIGQGVVRLSLVTKTLTPMLPLSPVIIGLGAARLFQQIYTHVRSPGVVSALPMVVLGTITGLGTTLILAGTIWTT